MDRIPRYNDKKARTLPGHRRDTSAGPILAYPRHGGEMGAANHAGCHIED